MERLRVTWTTGVGGTGLSTFYFEDGTAADGSSAVGSFFAALQPFIPAAVSISVPATGDVFDSATGELTGVWSGGTSSTTTGTSTTTNYAAGTGMYVRWVTAGVVAGRKVQGRTFLAPLANGQYDSQGSIVDATVSTMQAAAAALIADTGNVLQIWSRPRTTLAGTVHAVTSAVAMDKVTSLRSRRS
jgi:hypothetical protein